jgi:hypothetical protein
VTLNLLRVKHVICLSNLMAFNVSVTLSSQSVTRVNIAKEALPSYSNLLANTVIPNYRTVFSVPNILVQWIFNCKTHPMIDSKRSLSFAFYDRLVKINYSLSAFYVKQDSVLNLAHLNAVVQYIWAHHYWSQLFHLC